MIVFNPGTEGRSDHSEANAVEVAKRICDELGLPPFSRDQGRDDSERGLYAFRIAGVVEVDIPGDDPDEVCRGKPFESRRLYVDGSSWLYGYAVDLIWHRAKGKS